MEKNEIKKLLYKQNPTAKFQYIRKGCAHYTTGVKDEGGKILLEVFRIPVEDMGDADFTSEMEAKYLIRWIMD